SVRGRPLIRAATPRRRGRTGAAASCRGGPARTAGTGGTRAPGAGPLTSRTSASPRRAGRLEVVAPDPAAEAEFPGLGRLRPWLPRDGPRLVEQLDPVGDPVVLARVVRVG